MECSDTFLKLNIQAAYECGEYLGQVMFGRETLRQENREVVAQKWNAFVNEDKALTVINCGSHGSSINAGKIGAYPSLQKRRLQCGGRQF